MTVPPTIYIDGVDQVTYYDNMGITHVISIGHKGEKPPSVAHFGTAVKLHRFEFYDVHELNQCAMDYEDDQWPTQDDVASMIEVFKTFTADDKILFHCHAGISRSTAAAFICLVTLGVPYVSALSTVRWVRKKSAGRDVAFPNILLVKHADNILKHDGKMTEWMAERLGFKTYTFLFGRTLDLQRVRLWHTTKK